MIIQGQMWKYVRKCASIDFARFILESKVSKSMTSCFITTPDMNLSSHAQMYKYTKRRKFYRLSVGRFAHRDITPHSDV